ncbi:MAG TPA: enoyl-CoA hydratase/isomerase family protein [Spirochaetia bacterium]|nr:enoyl-CoA hydratase/isomerase family protein [Spirochaetia bacterium]
MALTEQYVDSHVAVVTLADGRRGNLLGPEMLSELTSAFEASVSDPEVRAILLRSSGPDFCRGMDLSRLAESRAGHGGAEAVKVVGLYADLLEAIFRARVPVLCFAQGETKAGGMGLVCACDVVITAVGAGFEMGEVIFGLLPANVLPYLLALRVPPQKSRYLVLSSPRVTAEEALRLNIVDEVVPMESAEKRIRDILKRLLRSSPRALADAKSFTAELIGKSPAEAGALGRRKLIEMLRDPDVLSGVTAFQEGGVPPWFSRFSPDHPLLPAPQSTDARGKEGG